MTVTIHLPSDIEADLIAQARAQGLDLPQYVEHVFRGHVPARTVSATSPADRAPACASPRAAFLAQLLFPMTPSAVRAYTAIAVDEHPGRHEYPTAADAA